MNSRKYMKLRNPAANFDNDDPSTTSLNHSQKGIDRPLTSRILNPEKLAWIIAGVAAIYFSGLYSQILPHQWPEKAWNWSLYLAYICFGLFVGLFIYLNYYLRYFHGIMVTSAHWKRDAPIAVPAATACGFGSFFFLFLGFLPVYRIWSFLLFPVIFLSFFAFLSIF